MFYPDDRKMGGRSRRSRNLLLASFFLSSALLFRIRQASDTLRKDQTLTDRETLVSNGQTFALGFFSTGGSSGRYFGIWYHSFSEGTPVWVANRANPIPDKSGVVKIVDTGKAVILDGRGNRYWDTDGAFSGNATLKLLDTGNLVLLDGDNESRVLWQSFSFPSNTLLPGMKIGLDLRSGENKMLTSWKTDMDPAPGLYSYGMDPLGSNQLFIFKGMYRYWRSGLWNGRIFEGIPEMGVISGYNYNFESNAEGISFNYSFHDRSTFTRLVLENNGQVKQWNWSQVTHQWELFWAVPKDPCYTYDSCGAYSSCSISSSSGCRCLEGFEPNSHDQKPQGTPAGCKRKTPLTCTRDDNFLIRKNMKLPENFSSLTGVRNEQCKEECLTNCSCIAYAYADVDGNGKRCLIWGFDLVDLTEYSDRGNDLYIRLASSEKGHLNVGYLLGIIAVVAIGSILLFKGLWILWRRQIKCHVDRTLDQRSSLIGLQLTLANVRNFASRHKDGKGAEESIELLMFDFKNIAAATNNFSSENKIGEGGFGSVYMGKLIDRQEVAVKRLSRSSGQGVEEFKNEVVVICELQHRNLVRLLGCCVHGEEKLLIYEYMINGSLDSLLFADRSKKEKLDWSKRVHIVAGIARGLLYLHHDSRLRIIHRDLKASNILLDQEMNPKISDFGMARIFGGDQMQATTKKVVGTYGYMSPEYAMKGLFSIKSDVFSFGVLLMEIVSGKRNSSTLNLLGYAWTLWNEGAELELLDPALGNSYSTVEVLKYIQVGLLCVQDNPGDRPTMASVVIMLESESAVLPPPKEPALYSERSLSEIAASSNWQHCMTINDITISTVDDHVHKHGGRNGKIIDVTVLFITGQNSYVEKSAMHQPGIEPGQCSGIDTVTATQPIRDGKFSLAFFSNDKYSGHRYVGIWYNKGRGPEGTVCWVANTDNPLTDSSGVATISEDGNLVVLEGRRRLLWSTNVLSGRGKASATIFDSGDLVLSQKTDENGRDVRVLWARFDHPVHVSSLRTGLKVEEFLLKGWKSTLVILLIILGLPLLVFCGYSWRRRKIKRKEIESCRELVSSTIELQEDGKSPELPFFDPSTLMTATNNFSLESKLGEGGFGSVYKGTLSNGQEIAVKRLSRRSGQGGEEFKNEVTLIAKLQHKNLVRILGCCNHREEKMLIYEYMRNKSLDSFIFDPSRRVLLDWGRRFHIIMGIARGVLYLHEDSRLMIIHRDLKASNILLDNQMNPKISDFGMARIFCANQTQANTNRIVGTYGYMSPEYAMDGLFSVKSDVFSFGVLMLEIVGGKSNNHYHQNADSTSVNLISQAWELWKGGRALELLDSSIVGSCPADEVLRCIQVGLLCVQESATERPIMSSVVFMLSNEEASLPSPQQPPPFSIRKTVSKADCSTSAWGSCSVNEVTISMVEAR
ncbi:G-type lectin S-receptor-like serine/threonine-protein kinase At4g27290 [Aristolochia californica]|uniref:G-type lectin S-receptor-like serine/threonine-protein kinase At4g27290 n=1 Tax=Aristolochia californica TaxID=171875 RepID=UPI0035E09026